MADNKTETKGFQLELLEYAFLSEDTDPCASVFKLYVPKLAGTMNNTSSTEMVISDSSSIANDTGSGGNNSSEKGSLIEARVSPEIMIAHRHDFHDCPGNCVNQTHQCQTCHSGHGTLKPCQHYHHDHHWPHLGTNGMIPKGSRVIVLFMNHDPKDGIVTRLICDFPDGAETPQPPKERR